MKTLSTKFVIFLMLGLFTWACEDDAIDVRQPDQAVASDEVTQSKTPANAKVKSDLLKNVDVDGVLSDGGTFEGNVTITKFRYDQTKGLLVSGILEGIATDADGIDTAIEQAFTDVEATLAKTSAGARIASTQAVCDILFLNIAPIHLDLLGLTVDLSEITLDINAVSGPGNLLGNLLCQVAGLLDPLTGLLNLIEQLNQLLNFLDLINNLLG